MKRLRSQLEDPDEELAFRLDSLADETTRVVVVELIWSLLFLAFMRNDFALVRGAPLVMVLSARAVVIGAGLATIAFFRGSEAPRRRDLVLTALILLQVALGLLVALTRPPGILPPVGSNVIGVLCIWALLPLAQAPQVLAASAASLGAVATVAILGRRLGGTELFMVGVELSLANVVGLSVSLMMNRERRRRWRAVREMLEAQRALAEARVRALEGDLIRVQRAAGLGWLSAALSHELAQPLTAVRNSAFAARAYLARDVPDVKGAESALESVAHNAQRGREIIDRLRGFMRAHEPRREPVSALAVAREAEALVLPSARQRRVDLTLDVQDDGGPALGDPVQLLQVAVIALVNALEALDEPTPNPSPEGAAGRREVRLFAHGRVGAWTMGVDDSGPGFAPEVRKQAFTPFFTTKAGGIGMGLSIASTIVEAHGGTIHVEQAPLGGARVSWTIPVEAGPG